VIDVLEEAVEVDREVERADLRIDVAVFGRTYPRRPLRSTRFQLAQKALGSDLQVARLAAWRAQSQREALSDCRWRNV
jgi:hypothetical protein